MEDRYVVTCFLEHDGKVLILRRSEKVGTYRGRWAGVSGYIETSADEQALTEIREETQLVSTDVELIKKGDPLEVVDDETGIRWHVHPYLFRVADPGKVVIDWEHTEAKWIDPGDLGRYETVPALGEALGSVRRE